MLRMCMPGFVAFWTSRWGSRTLGGRSVVSGGRRRLGLAGGGIVLAWGGRPVGSREEAKKRRTRSSQTTRVIDCGVEESELRKEGGRGVVIFGCAKNHEQVARAYRGMEPWVGLFAGDGWVFGVSTGLQGYRAKYPHIHRSIDPSIHRSIDPHIHRSIDPSIHRSIDPSIHRSIDPLGHWAIGPLGHWAPPRFRPKAKPSRLYLIPQPSQTSPSIRNPTLSEPKHLSRPSLLRFFA
ncbi:MAG: hypothetical protein ACI9X4_002664 [Glaciecola sp.]|jgi:hypothetical protein